MGKSTTEQNFDREYAGQGGVVILLKLYQQGLSSPEIGRTFGLQGKQIDYYLKRIVGESYIAYPWRKVMAERDDGPHLNQNGLEV